MVVQRVFSSGTLIIAPSPRLTPIDTGSPSAPHQLFSSGILTLDDSEPTTTSRSSRPQEDEVIVICEDSEDEELFPDIAVLANTRSSPAKTPEVESLGENNVRLDSNATDELFQDVGAHTGTSLSIRLEQHDKFRRILHSQGSTSYFLVSRRGQIEEIEVQPTLRHVPSHSQVNPSEDAVIDDACLVHDGAKSMIITGCVQENKQLVSIPLSPIISSRVLDRPWNRAKKCGVGALCSMLQPGMFASGGYDHQIHLWDMSPQTQDSSFTSLSTSTLAAPRLLNMKHTSSVQALLPHRDTSHKLISGGADCILNVYDMASERVAHSLKSSNSIYNLHDGASPFCILLEVAHRDLQFEQRDYRIVPERPVMRFGYECQQFPGKFIRGDMLPGHKLFACGDREGTVRLWDMRNTGKVYTLLTCAQGQKIAQVMFHDRSRLLACTENSQVVLVTV